MKLTAHRSFAMLSFVALVIQVFNFGVGTTHSLAQAAQGGTRTFPETGKTLRNTFLTYWDSHGGLAQQGYPISDEMHEKSDTDGKT